MPSLVDLEQTSPIQVCPGDDVSFICTVTVSGTESLALLWINPNNGSDSKFYSIDDPIGDSTVGAFTTEIVSDTITSTATVNNITLVDIMSAGITCIDSVSEMTLYVADSGKKTNDACM